MLDPVNDLLPPPSSPTISSVSSSDLDTEVSNQTCSSSSIFQIFLQIAAFSGHPFGVSFQNLFIFIGSMLGGSRQGHSSMIEARHWEP